MYSVQDLYDGVYKVIGIRIVFDYHHHCFNTGGLTEREALALATAEANASREAARKEIDSQKESAMNQLKIDAEKLGDLIVERLLAAK